MTAPCTAKPCPEHVYRPWSTADCGDLSLKDIEQIRADAARVERLAQVVPLAANVARGTRALADQLERAAHKLGLEFLARTGQIERRRADADARAMAPLERAPR
jgi:hypothetical protein